MIAVYMNPAQFWSMFGKINWREKVW